MSKQHTISDYDEASKALRERNLRQALYDEGSVIMQDVLVNLHGDEHRARRSLETQVFRRDFFRYYETEVFPTTLKETLAPYIESGEMDLVDFGYRVMVNLTVDFTGIDRPLKTPEETADLMALTQLFGRTATMAHATVDRDALRAEAREALDRFDETYVVPSIASRTEKLQQLKAGEITEEDLPRDVLTVLLRNEDNIDMTRDMLTREMAFFTLAGAHTSIHTLTHAMHEMLTWTSAHPEDRKRIDEAPRFIQRCVFESIRLHPSSPIASRRSLCPMHIEQHDIEEGDSVIIDLQTANRSTDMFGSDASEFNPHRDIPKGQQGYGLSFGRGMHACLGLNLAAGVMPPEDKTVDHMGTVALISQVLFQAGVRPDPDKTAEKDTRTERDLWGYYPVRLGPV
ncbi:MAG: cytochrome P450 [Pseudomonadales bacterium]|nr:cytochrome P450 [Pseudomonadales bacterium]MBO6594874.1 cytochrome P450 [Pseudomonadales bacterium]MBO6821566.1 cytochrome P450 [Pseudomonadales bacterium]